MTSRGKLTIAVGPIALVSLAACAAVTGLGDYEIIDPVTPPDGSSASSDGGGASDGQGPTNGTDSGAADALVDAATDALLDADVDAALPPVVDCPNLTTCNVVVSNDVLDVATAASAIYWIDTSNTVRTARLDGTGARVFAAGESGPLAGIEAANGFVYWTANGSLRRAPQPGMAGSLGTIGNVTAGCIKTGTSHVFVASPSTREIVTFAFDTNAKDVTVNNSDKVWGVLVDNNSDLFFTTYDAINGKIFRKPAAAPPTYNPLQTVNGEAGPRCLATDGNALYWANRDSGELRKSKNKDGGNASTLVGGQPLIQGVSIGTKYVYWSFQGGIRRRAL